ncbi:MAG: ferritin [Chloroflexi bacterium]|nr:ferritin [Chloroflexota bacterium]
MISDSLQNAINEQIAREQYASQLYLSIAGHFELRNLRGFATWMRRHSVEETSHAMKLFDFLADRGGRIEVKALPQPINHFQSVQAAFEAALDHERQVSKDIHKLYEMAQAEKDYSSHVLFEWFVTEQVEEEKTLEEILEHVRLVGNNNGMGLLLLDQQLAAKTGVATAAAGRES